MERPDPGRSKPGGRGCSLRRSRSRRCSVRRTLRALDPAPPRSSFRSVPRLCVWRRVGGEHREARFDALTRRKPLAQLLRRSPPAGEPARNETAHCSGDRNTVELSGESGRVYCPVRFEFGTPTDRGALMESPGPPFEPVPPVRSASQPVKATTESRVAKAFGLEGEHWMRHAAPPSACGRDSVGSRCSRWRSGAGRGSGSCA